MRRAAFLFFVVFVSLPRVAWTQGNPLGSEFRVNSYTTSYQLGPSVAADSAGNFVVVWHSLYQDGSNWGIFGQRYASAGNPLGPEFRVNTYTTSNQQYPSVVSDSSGNFVVVWHSDGQDGSYAGVFGQRYAATGAALGLEFRVNTYTTGGQYGPAVAADPSGNFVVVWTSGIQDGSTYGVFGQRYASSGAPLGSEFRVNTYTTNAQNRPAVAANLAGDFIVVWQSYGQEGPQPFPGVFGQRYASSGTPLGPEFRVNTYTTLQQGYPSVVADSSGNFVVVWQSDTQDGSGLGVFGQRYASTGSPLGPEFRVNTSTTAFQAGPSVAADVSGNFVVTWGGYVDVSHWGVFGQRYASSGTPLGPEFRVNTYTTNVKGDPSVAADSFGNFVVTWVSFGQDGSNAGIFGQRYSQIVPVELMHFRVE